MRISVIIPVYNAERYLPTCIESLLVQTMPDFELLLINDGSTDNSKAVCDRYAAQDRRIRVFDSPNRGVSAARNLGLDQARGEFVVFVDSDDWVVPEHLQQFTESGIGEDGIAFTNLFEERPGRRKMPRTRIYTMSDCRVMSGHNDCMPVIADLLRHRGFGWTWNKMFSRATIERLELRFDESLHYAEDEVFTIQYCAHITHIVTFSHPTYHYRFVPGSLLHRRIEPQTLIRTRLKIIRLFERLEYSNEILYLANRTLFSRLRREMRRCERWNSDTANILAYSILCNWEVLKKYYCPAFCRSFYDRKILLLGRLICSIKSTFWVKLMIKGFHQ